MFRIMSIPTEMGVAYLDINKLPCLHETDIPKCTNVYSIYRSLKVYQRSYSQVGLGVARNFVGFEEGVTLKIVRQNPPRSE